MTGQVFAVTPPHRVSMAYSIDSFSSYSTAAVSRTPTRAIVPPSSTVSFNSYMDEELFRDLFADADADTEQRDAIFGASVASPQRPSKSNVTPNKAMVWHTGATLTKPFASPPTQPQNQTPGATVSAGAPTLSAPHPRQNAMDLMTTRPHARNEEDEVSTQHGLPGVPEVSEEDQDDGDACGVATASLKLKSTRRVLSPLPTTLKTGGASIQHETLQFLEKLDLKALLAQPRPDVTSFLPPSNQVSHSFHDPRVEENDLPRPVASHASIGIPMKKPLSSRKEPLQSLTAGSTRLAHMAQTYGTTAGGSKKARKETIERLSNPITGHTSTLQALSPELRKKREIEEGSWPPAEKATTPVKTLTSKKTRDLIERLAAVQPTKSPASSRGGAKKLVKGQKPTMVAVRAAVKPRTNQDDAEPTPRSKVRSTQKLQVTLDERKALLKQKLATRSSAQAESTSTSSGSTFLTQHEDNEAKLASRNGNAGRSYRKLVPQRPHESKPTLDFRLPLRPAMPPSVRVRPAVSNAVATPSKPSRATPHKPSDPRSRASSHAKESSVSQQKPAIKTARSATKGAGSGRPGRTEIVSTRKPRPVVATSTANNASSTLLGTTSAAGPKPPVGRGAQSNPRVKASVSKDISATEISTRQSLPVIRRPAPAAPEIASARVGKRAHRIRTTG